jgi:hypothetical protein
LAVRKSNPDPNLRDGGAVTKQIQLTQGQVAQVDDWRYEELSQWKWQAQWNKYTRSFYALRSEGTGLFRKHIHMHREIAHTPKGLDCDHINHDTLDCQEHNLRNATRSQNQMNSRVRSDNKLAQKGICPHGSGYRVQVKKDGRYVFDKTFRTLDEAIAARDEAVKKFHGEYSYQG